MTDKEPTRQPRGSRRAARPGATGARRAERAASAASPGASRSPAAAQPLNTEEAEAQAWAAFGDFLRAQRRLAQLSLRQLADRTHVSNPYLSQIERGLYRPSAAVLKSIAGALGIAPQTVFARAGLLDESPEATRPPGVEASIALATELTTEQKEALVAVYRSMVGATRS